MNENRLDQVAKLGDTEEWTIVNTDQQYHSFHIHQTAFLVTKINGPNSPKVIIPFTGPVIVGKLAYHCHAVDHEDKGMMGVPEGVE